MQSRNFKNCRRAGPPRGGAAIVILNIIVLLLIVGLAGGYYFVQMRPKRAAGEFAKAREFEKKGHVSSAELHYRKAVHLDPGNIHFQRSLDALVRGGGNLAEIEMEELSNGPRSASAALWPEEARVASTPSLAGVPATESGVPGEAAARESEAASDEIAKAAAAAPAVNTIAPPPPVRVTRRNVEIDIVAPGNAEFEIRAVNVEDHVPGQSVEPWSPVRERVQRELRPGQYEIAVRAPWAEPVVAPFAVKESDKVLQGVKLEFGLLKIGGEPAAAKIYDEASGKLVGRTPFVALMPPGMVAYTLKADGYESSAIEGVVEARGVLYFSHHLAQAAPKPKASPPAAPKAEPKPAPAVAEAKVVPGAVESAPAPAAAPASTMSSSPVVGSSFISADGVEYIFGEKSNRGDPFWMSRSAPLAGRSEAGARDYCAELTMRERAAGRLPKGYGYFPSLARDGRIALCVEYVQSGSGVVRKPEVDTAPTLRPLVLSDPAAPSGGLTQEYRSHVAGGSAVTFGEPFLNGDRVWMDYGEADSYGNPYWISATGAVMGMSRSRANQYCWDMTKREREAGRVPGGYRYAPLDDGSGKVVLGRTAPGSVSAGR